MSANPSIFNPLDTVKDVEKQTSKPTQGIPTNLKSTSRCLNEVPGICLKCKGKMTTARIAKGDTVYFCESCRVSSPIEDRS